MSLLEGSIDVEGIGRRLGEVAGGCWVGSRVTTSAFLVVGQEEVAVSRLVEAGFLAVGGALFYI